MSAPFVPAGLYRILEDAKIAAATTETVLASLAGTLTDPAQVTMVRTARNNLRFSDLTRDAIEEDGGDPNLLL
jgi:hypothetical protein